MPFRAETYEVRSQSGVPLCIHSLVGLCFRFSEFIYMWCSYDWLPTVSFSLQPGLTGYTLPKVQLFLPKVPCTWPSGPFTQQAPSVGPPYLTPSTLACLDPCPSLLHEFGFQMSEQWLRNKWAQGYWTSFCCVLLDCSDDQPRTVNIPNWPTPHCWKVHRKFKVHFMFGDWKYQ